MFVASNFFDVDGVSLEYQLLTPPGSHELTLVLLHEGLGCVAMWKDFPRRLAELTGCRVLVYSRAGYGGSAPCRLPRPLRFMHDEALDVLPKLLSSAKIEQAVLIGHSDGASIALINAGDLNDSRIKGLVLMAPHVLVEELTIRSIRQARSAYAKTDLRAKLARYHDNGVDDTFCGWCQAWLDPDFLDWNIESYLPKIEVPVLLIQGEDDNYGTLRQLDIITENLPAGAERIVLSNCGHAPFRDRAPETLQGIARFLQIHFECAL